MRVRPCPRAPCPDEETDHLPPQHTLTLRQAAERLGLHYMTVYRHVRTGRLPARWVDGQWLVDEADLVATTPPVRSGRRMGWHQWQARLEARLLAGDEQGAWTVAQAALASGAAAEAVLLDALGPAMASIGERWAAGDVSVADEHRASQVAIRVLARMGPLSARPGRKRATVVVGTPPGERHALPGAMVADVLRGAGYQVVDLGVDVPVAMFAEVARRSPDAVLVGVTVGGQEEAVAQVVSAVRAAAPGVPVLAGGAGLAEAAARAAGADGWSGRDAREALAALAASTGRGGASGDPAPAS